VEISRSRLLHNFNEFRKLAPARRIAPVLKSNAYGHGLAEVASILAKSDFAKSIPFFVVDSYFEALALRSAGVHHQILVIGYTRPETIISSRLERIVYTITSLEMLRFFESIDRPIHIHLKIDTGMHRQGVRPEEASEAIGILGENPSIVLRGICTHLCDADDNDASYTDAQIATWNKVARQFKISFPSLEYMHVAATDGHKYTGIIEANVSRLGIGLYGLSEGKQFKPKLKLKPVLEMRTIITGVKKLLRDEFVGYSTTFRAERNMTIATIPVGYFEGIDRRLSSTGSVYESEKRIPVNIIGRVSMNITSLDVSDLPGAKIGTEITVISHDPEKPNSIMNMAKLARTIPYDIAVHIPSLLKRTVVD
jgi:alanine racemase